MLTTAVVICIAIVTCMVPLRYQTVSAIAHPEELVNLLAGSFTDGATFSTGNTLPLVGRPWGFNHWAPQTKDGSRNTGSWWFKGTLILTLHQIRSISMHHIVFTGSDHVLTWLRCTHQPSPWIGDWGWFLFTPMLGELTRNPMHFWEPRAAVLKPYLLDATVAPFSIRIELTPTDHCAFVRITFPQVCMALSTSTNVDRMTDIMDPLIGHRFW